MKYDFKNQLALIAVNNVPYKVNTENKPNSCKIHHLRIPVLVCYAVVQSVVLRASVLIELGHTDSKKLIFYFMKCYVKVFVRVCFGCNHFMKALMSQMFNGYGPLFFSRNILYSFE